MEAIPHVVDLGAAGGAEVASWALPPHARTARFRIYTLGLVAAEGADSPERQAVTAAIRRYVEENLLAFVDVSGVGQAAEGNFLTPKLVGGKVGLHPVWLMFALSAFGSLFGFVGLLVAVPAAAAIGVFGRFLIERYRDGRLYQGSAEWQGRATVQSDQPDEEQE